MDYGGNQARNAYNDSLGYLGRINAIWYKIDAAKAKLDVWSWFNWLMVQHMELITQIEPDDRPRYDVMVAAIQKLIFNAYSDREGCVCVRGSLYQALRDFEVALRDVWHAAGLDMKIVEDSNLEEL